VDGDYHPLSIWGKPALAEHYERNGDFRIPKTSSMAKGAGSSFSGTGALEKEIRGFRQR
jgi:hypothetical protein